MFNEGISVARGPIQAMLDRWSLPLREPLLFPDERAPLCLRELLRSQLCRQSVAFFCTSLLQRSARPKSGNIHPRVSRYVISCSATAPGIGHAELVKGRGVP